MNHSSKPPLRSGTITAAKGQMESDCKWVAHRSILAYGVRIGIRTNQPRFLKRILEHVPPLWKPSSSTSVDRQFSFHFARGPLVKGGSSRHFLWDDFAAATESTGLQGLLQAFEVRIETQGFG